MNKHFNFLLYTYRNLREFKTDSHKILHTNIDSETIADSYMETYQISINRREDKEQYRVIEMNEDLIYEEIQLKLKNSRQSE